MENNSESGEFYMIDKKYNIIKKISEGGYGKVYLAEDQITKEKFAIKVIIEITPEFEKEISILKKVSSLNNPYIINLKNYGESQIKKNSKEINQYIIMEYASNGDFYDYIMAAQNGLEEKYAKFIFKKILIGVQAIHESGFCHRDLKMQNILLDEFYNPRICDFGLSAKIEGEDGSGKLTDKAGTEGYFSPEINEKKPYEGIKVDIFCLGIILFNISTSKMPFKKAKKNNRLYNLIIKENFDEYWKLIEFNIGSIPQLLKNLFIKMVAYNPEKRPNSIKEILDDAWMKEINDLNDEEYKKLEDKVNQKFKELGNIIKANNEDLNTNKSFNQNVGMEENRDISDNLEKEYFNLDLAPKYISKTDLNMKHYIKLNGHINPAGFMNSLANEIKNKFGDNCEIQANKQKLKFNVIFENLEETEENENENLEKKEEMKDLEEEKSDDEILNEKENSIIQIKLFESINGGYVVRFAKRQGEYEDYHKNMKNVKKIIKDIL